MRRSHPQDARTNRRASSTFALSVAGLDPDRRSRLRDRLDGDVVEECATATEIRAAVEAANNGVVLLILDAATREACAGLLDRGSRRGTVLVVVGEKADAAWAFQAGAVDFCPWSAGQEAIPRSVARARARLRKEAEARLGHWVREMLAADPEGRRLLRQRALGVPRAEGAEISGLPAGPRGPETEPGPPDGGSGGSNGRREASTTNGDPSESGGPSRLRRFAIHRRGRVFFVKAEDVDWIEAANCYARLHVGDDSHLVRMTMKMLDATLDPDRFFRIHRSTIVNLDRVREVQPCVKGESVVILHDGTRLALSRRQRRRLQERLGQRL